MSTRSIATASGALAIGYAVTLALFWALLNVPESSVPALALSAALAVLVLVAAGLTTAGGAVLVAGATPSAAASPWRILLLWRLHLLWRLLLLWLRGSKSAGGR